MFLTTHVTVCICHAELKKSLTYLFTYYGENAKRLGAKRPVGELPNRRNVYKSFNILNRLNN